MLDAYQNSLGDFNTPHSLGLAPGGRGESQALTF